MDPLQEFPHLVRHPETGELVEEEWKPVNGYNRWYEISNYGRLISWKNNNHGNRAKEPKLLKPISHNAGYKDYCLRKNGRTTRYLRHVLVAKHFVDNPQNLPEVNHKDGDKSNDFYLNLEWCTHAENMKHGFDTGLINNRGENNGNTSLTKDDVIEIKYLLQNAPDLTQKDIANRYNVAPQTINGIKNGRRWNHVTL